jgi:Nucleotide-diphospho-sugar transferase
LEKAMKQRNVRLILSLLSGILVLAYVIGLRFQNEKHQNKIQLRESSTATIAIGKDRNKNSSNRVVEIGTTSSGSPAAIVDHTMMIGKTKVVAFCNYNYRSVALVWYHRMTKLGYTTHTIVATDQDMVQFLQHYNNNNNNSKMIRFDIWIHSPLPEKYADKPRTKQDHYVLELLMAVRWKYLLQQLQQGMHILLTDVDNIFTSYHDPAMSSSSSSSSSPGPNHQQYNIDVWHAYATKYPRRTFAVQGFVVCSGMSWWRSSPASIHYAELMQKACGEMCDDQRVLNALMEQQLNMTWDWTPQVLQSRIGVDAASLNATSTTTTKKKNYALSDTTSTTPDPRYVGLLTKSLTGRSNLIPGLQLGIWDRNFAFRGPLYPNPCPNAPHWVSMPVLEASSRGKAWLVKAESFAEWDKHCGGQRVQ